MQPAEHFTASDTGAAAPENAAQAEPQAAPSESPQPTADKSSGAAEAAADNAGNNAKPRAKAQERRRHGKGSRAAGSETGPSDQPPTMQERLLTRLTVPPVTVDRRLLPANLIDALDAAGLGARETLPAAALMALAAVTAVAGPGVRCEIGGDHGLTGNTALRVALIAPDRRASLVPSAILAGAIAAENAARDRYDQAAQLDAEDRRAAAERRRLHAKATELAIMLGAPPAPPLAEAAPARCGTPPCIVVRDGAAAAIRLAAAGGTGLIVVDQRRMTSMKRAAGFYDDATETLLTDFARGDQVPIVDPKRGRTLMRSLPASVLDVLTTADCALLHEVAAASYMATVFVPAVPAVPVGNQIRTY